MNQYPTFIGSAEIQTEGGACAQRRPVLQALTRAAAIEAATCSCSTEKKDLAKKQKLGGEPQKPQDTLW